jgi:hypothetical protein
VRIEAEDSGAGTEADREGEAVTAPRKKRPRARKRDSSDKFQQLKSLEAWRRVLSKGEAFVFLVLWNVQPGDCSSFWISQSRIGERIGLSREGASRLTESLCRRGLIVKIERGHAGGKANTYRIPVPLPDPPSSPKPSGESDTSDLVSETPNLVLDASHQ